MKTRFVVPSCLLLSLLSFSQVKIKGHQIGEGSGDFLNIEPALRDKLAQCRSNPPRQITEEEAKGMKFPDGTSRKDYLELARKGRLFDRNVDAYERECKPLLNTFELSIPGSVNTEFLPTPDAAVPMRATWHFEHGKVVGLDMSVFGQWSEVRDDLNAKSGVKPSEQVIPYHNGFGATWENRYAEWLTPEVHIALYQNNNPVSGDVRPFLTIEPRAKYDAQQKLKSTKSPLD